jgi:hypothetical protein
LQLTYSQYRALHFAAAKDCKLKTLAAACAAGAGALQVAMTAAATPHNSKPSAMQSHLNKLLLLVPTTLLQLASASYGVLRSAASAPQLLDSCIADTVGPKFDFDKLNDECNELLLGNDSFNASRADLVAGAAAVALPQLHIRLPTAAESAAAEAEALLAPGTPPQQ